MDLTTIRNRVLSEIKKLPPPHNKATIDDIDDAINLVQETYIQPVSLEKGKVDYTARGEVTVTGEEPTTTDDLTFHSEYKPFKHGTVKVFVDGEEVAPVDENGDTVFTVKYNEGAIVFEASQSGKDVTVNYTAYEVVEKNSLADDIYKINAIRDITHSFPGIEVNYFNVNDAEYPGIRSIQEYKDSLHLNNIDKDTVLRLFYDKKLKPLGNGDGEVITPEIPSGWHDLYWIGALAQFDMGRLSMFLDRLEAYAREQRDIKDTSATRVKSIW